MNSFCGWHGLRHGQDPANTVLTVDVIVTGVACGCVRCSGCCGLRHGQDPANVVLTVDVIIALVAVGYNTGRIQLTLS